jgi:hypothetical protein
VSTQERLAWLFADVEAAGFDPVDERDRESLIELQHPELRAALSDPDVDEIEVAAGYSMNPRLHIAMHQGVADQIVNEDPREVWQTALRLEALGYNRHDVLHMLASVLGEEIRLMLGEQRPYEPERHLAALEALPGSWEAMRPRGPGRLPGARATGGRRRRKGRRR